MRKDPILGFVLLLGAALRFWKIGGDLPYVFHFDEPTLIDNAVWMLQDRTLNPPFFNYPTGLIYLFAGIFGLVLLGGITVGRFDGWADALHWLSAGTYPRPPEGGVLYFYPTFGVPALYLIGRGISAISGVVTIALVYELARRMAGEIRTARIAALLFAVSPLAVEQAHLATTDTLATACATAVLLIVVTGDCQNRPRWILSGVLAGLAAGIKYNAGLIALTLPLLALWRVRHGVMKALGGLLLPAGAALAVFLFTTPFALFDAASFFRDLSFEFHRVAAVTTAFAGAEAVEVTAADKFATILRHNLGIPGILVGLWGFIGLVRTRRFAAFAVLLWLIVLIMPQLGWRRLYPRYLLLVWPTILLLVAIGIDRIAGSLVPSPKRERLLAQILMGIVLIVPTLRLFDRERARIRPDPRIEMTEWIEANLPEGERIVIESGGPFPSAERFSLDRVDFLGRSTPGDYRDRGIRYLTASGQQRRVEGSGAFEKIFVNLEEIAKESEIVWQSGRHVVYRLKGEAGWVGTVDSVLASGDWRSARDLLEQVVHSEDNSPYAWKRLGALRVEAGDTAAAVEAYRQAARLDSCDVEVLLTLGNLFLDREQFDEAIAMFESALLPAPNDPLVFHNLGVAFLSRARARYRAGEKESAEQDWRKAKDQAAICSKFAPEDREMARIGEQVERMGRRWGFGP